MVDHSSTLTKVVLTFTALFHTVKHADRVFRQSTRESIDTLNGFLRKLTVKAAFEKCVTL